jgi:hypothetical protein
VPWAALDCSRTPPEASRQSAAANAAFAIGSFRAAMRTAVAPDGISVRRCTRWKQSRFLLNLGLHRLLR